MTTQMQESASAHRSIRACDDYRPGMIGGFPTRLRPGAWVLAGAVVAVLVVGESLSFYDEQASFASYAALPILAILTGSAITVSRSRPGTGLVLAWLSFPFWAATPGPLLVSQLGLAAVAFQCGRRGAAGVVVAAVASSIAAPIAVVLDGGDYARGPLEELVLGATERFTSQSFGGYVVGALVLLLAASVVPLVPLISGLIMRVVDRSRISEAGELEARREADDAYADAATAHELARLQEAHAQLARDVHDVVGHSLTVVVAQAEAGQYAGDDPETLRTTLRTIAETARASLADVRQVLAETDRTQVPDRRGGTVVISDLLPGLVDGLRVGGHTVEVHEEGHPRPLPPELTAVAHRVTQEMLTNAARHGDRDSVIEVERHWDGEELRLDVRNALPHTSGSASETEETRPLAEATHGRGIDGMRERLDAVGGRLDVRRREGRGEEAGTFTTTAWIPLRPVDRATSGTGR